MRRRQAEKRQKKRRQAKGDKKGGALLTAKDLKNKVGSFCF